MVRDDDAFSALLLRGGRPVRRPADAMTSSDRPANVSSSDGENSGASLGRSVLRNGISGRTPSTSELSWDRSTLRCTPDLGRVSGKYVAKFRSLFATPCRNLQQRAAPLNSRSLRWCPRPPSRTMH